ncbi:23S rRNA pseudouridine2605 synthase [Chryseolinea serpens]|uniref:Pseudouridine synthase n=1 Tax=Chryseolinea serpens TaxID=947013 RepID=A0A1M5XGA0_9BACT|nr:pseudouridine synthase [Chryseolinea serpens]SHH98769.1 23S rRNA pseudouridine2605 synthase [Chryseolinea serpens]
MPRSDSSSSSRGRKGPSSKSTGGRSAGRSGDKPFKKPAGKSFRKDSDGGSFAAKRSAKPFSKDRDDKPAFKKKSFGDEGGTKRPYKKFDSGDKPSFGKRTSASSRGERPFKKAGSDDKPFGDRRRSSSTGPREERPYKKFSGDDKPFGDRRRSSSSGPREEKPYKKSSSGDKPFGDRRRSSSAGPREERPYKRASSDDKPFGDKRRSSSAPREERPYKKRADTGDKPSFRDKDASRGERPFKKADDAEDRSPRKFDSGNFGKPYKKAYPKKDDEGEKPVRRERSERSAPLESRSDRPVEKFDKAKIVRRKASDSATAAPAKSNEAEAPAQTGKIRLNKFIANSGVCSRREADELITMGLISVNGKTITELGYKVNPGDEVRHESKVLRAEKPVYILMNKPKGFLTTTSDPQERNTVMHIIANHVKERVYPVGRLDRNTTGLLLLTNDGDLADKLMHPSYNVKKIYKVELDRPITKGDAQTILEGVKLEEGRAVVDDIAIVSEDRKTVGLEIHIGWNRVVRRIFESLEYQVVKLDRSVYAGLNKKDLGRGEWRFLTKEELILLKHYK